jgi:hypothetical protein
MPMTGRPAGKPVVGDCPGQLVCRHAHEEMRGGGSDEHEHVIALPPCPGVEDVNPGARLHSR